MVFSVQYALGLLFTGWQSCSSALLPTEAPIIIAKRHSLYIFVLPGSFVSMNLTMRPYCSVS
jgi:hypothetical protein